MRRAIRQNDVARRAFEFPIQHCFLRDAAIGNSRSLDFQFLERLQSPGSFGRGSISTQDVEVSVIGTHFEERIVKAIPLVQYLVHDPNLFPNLKPDWPLVRLPPA